MAVGGVAAAAVVEEETGSVPAKLPAGPASLGGRGREGRRLPTHGRVQDAVVGSPCPDGGNCPHHVRGPRLLCHPKDGRHVMTSRAIKVAAQTVVALHSAMTVRFSGWKVPAGQPTQVPE